MSVRRPTIGVFDSGVGGLTVLRALLRRVPDANYLYFGDTARLPYGSKSASTVAHYAVGAIQYLQDQGAELLVIACNTATALAFDEIRAASKVEVVGVIEPGADAASAASRNRKVAVIGTEATVSSHAYRIALEARQVTVTEKACPLFVPLVEEGWIDHPVTEQVARIYLNEAFSNEAVSSGGERNETAADVLLLGCTHYPLIQPLLRRIAPAHVTIVDSADSTAHEVARKLETVAWVGSGVAANNIAARGEVERAFDEASVIEKSTFESGPKLRFFATDSAEKFKRMGTRFLGFPVQEVLHVDMKE